MTSPYLERSLRTEAEVRTAMAAKKAKIQMRKDFENLEDGARITLFPNNTNPLHKKPVKATYTGGYYYCDNPLVLEGPDYYFRDVAVYNDGFELESTT